MPEEQVTTTTAATEEPEVEQTQTPAADSWIPEGLRENKSLSKFKTPADVAQAYVNLEQHLGKRFEAPGEDATPEQRAEWRKKIGVPDTADAYENPAVPEGVTLDDSLVSSFKKRAHEVGISAKDAKALMDWFVSEEMSRASALESQTNEAKSNALADLKKKWGAAADQNIAYCQRAINDFGGPDLVAALNETGAGNDPRVIQFFAKIGRTMGEHNLIPAHDIGMTTSNARDEITKIRSAAAGDRKHPYRDSSHPEHKKIVARMKELYTLAYPDTEFATE